MKRLTCLFLILSIASLPIEGRLYAQEIVVSKSQAEGVLNSYFNLLKTGDTSGILNLLTGPLLKQKEILLRDNPTYGEFLKERYKNAQFFVIGQKLTSKKRLALDVLVVFNGQEELETRLIFINKGDGVKIFAEKDPGDNKSDD